MKVTLTPSDMMVGVQIGARRYIESTINHRGDKAGFSNGWENTIEGALAEVAVAKALNMYLDPNLGKFGAADVGQWHVRQTHYENGHLRIEQHETNGKYLLVVGRFSDYRIAGWIDAKEAHKQKYKKRMSEGRPEAYWIPQEDLEPIK